MLEVPDVVYARRDVTIQCTAIVGVVDGVFGKLLLQERNEVGSLFGTGEQ